MTGESNKGRFKCADEAQAAWKLFERRVANIVRRAFKGELGVESQNAANEFFAFFANDLQEARLIHGSIYDEDKRIENKDVAHLVYILHKRFGFGMKAYQFDEFVHRMTLKGLLKGTIFYE